MKITNADTEETGKFKFIGFGLGVLADIGFRIGKLKVCCSLEGCPCPSVSDFGNIKAHVTTGSLAFILGVGYTKITFEGVGKCGNFTASVFHGEVGGAGLGLGTYWGKVTPVIP